MKEQNSAYYNIPCSLLETWLRMSVDDTEFAIKERYSNFLIDEFGNLDVANRFLNSCEDTQEEQICSDGRFF